MRVYFSFSWICSGGGARFLPASWRIGAGSGTLVRLRSSLSQCRSRRNSLLPAGRKARTRSSYADARFVSRIRLLVMGVGASRRTTSIMTGSGFAGAAADAAGRPSPSFHCSLFLTRITVWWRGVRRCSGALWNIARGRRLCYPSRIPTACRTHRQCGAGRVALTALSLRLPFSVRPSPASLTGCLAAVRFLIRPGRCPG